MYKVGEKVLVVPNLREYCRYDRCMFVPQMRKYLGKVVTIRKTIEASTSEEERYMIEGEYVWYFSNPMLMSIPKDKIFIKLRLYV